MADTMKQAVDLSGEKIHWDQDISYDSYLDLGTLLDAQKPRSGEHDEMLFIIIHQSAELWMKLCIHEISGAMEQVKQDDLRPAFKMLSRVSKIQAQLLQSWEVLSTMTPSDYAKFRDTLGQSSGFQSFQYRTMEFALGNKNADMVKAHRSSPERFESLSKILAAPSFYDLTLQLLAKRGLNIPEKSLSRDWSEPYVASKGVEDAWKLIYENPNDYWDLYELAEKLVDLEYHFQQWRFAHMKTVERIIGFRRGTGGTGGVSYLVKALDLRFFPELWTVRTNVR